MLLDKINEDLKDAMRGKDALTLSVIRMLKGDIQLKKISKGNIDDDDIIAIISKQIKMRKDAIEQFSKANRQDLVTQNEQEIDILTKYLPEQLDESEVIKIIDEAFAKINPTSNKDMGIIMREVSSKVKGRFDMQKVSAIIKSKLNWFFVK